jgi:hypothetical protein
VERSTACFRHKNVLQSKLFNLQFLLGFSKVPVFLCHPVHTGGQFHEPTALSPRDRGSCNLA